MFELIQSIRIDTEKGRASGEAFVPADHPLFADHFPGQPLLPGSLILELAAQVGGPLAEESARATSGVERWAILGMVRDARFLRPVFLPATLAIQAEISRSQNSSVNTNVTVAVDGERVMQAELVLMLLESTPDWSQAIDERNHRLARWKEAS
ncbi:MAG TPA: 3-hydroxyacyl-ACP dehydratase FabZ family protein [Pyrinomonadaceae bacterium]|nr:3-hydroxyacyl-ACP dehydratase FabZ family protein [Pyrinomonadaceae bacterium]